MQYTCHVSHSVCEEVYAKGVRMVRLLGTHHKFLQRGDSHEIFVLAKICLRRKLLLLLIF